MKHQLIDQKCTAFANEIANVVRTIVLDALKTAGTARISPAKKTAQAKKSHLPMGLAPGQKRKPEDITSLTEHLRRYITRQPGLTIEAISTALNIPTRELLLPVKKLLAEGAFTTTGQKRATRYFAVFTKG